MELEYRRKKATVSLINYHFVFCPRYRRKIFKNPKVEKRFREIVHEVSYAMEVEVIAIKCFDDHVHLFLGVFPQYSPADVVGRIKHVSSTKLREEFKELNRAVSLWTRSFFVSTSYDTPDATISDYLNEQKKRG